jgi:4-hydroxy-2-oxoheptanedioate aldolase
LDFVLIDTEHIPVDRNEVAMLCQVYNAIGLTTLVRIPCPDPYLACMAKDAGAKGIIAPYVEDVAQILRMVGATKYRPLKGKRLERVLEGVEKLEPQVQAYLDEYNEGSICLVNIESLPAIDNLSALLDVPGLDAVIVGPHDLSINMGLPEQYDHPDFENRVRTIIRQTREKGLAAGVHFPCHPDLHIKWIKEGANIVVHGSDMFLFIKKLNEDMARMKTHAATNDVMI